ncbi:heme-binding protein [Cyanobium sp. FGCU-6]|jgi:glc operon protein GlcG|nr:heme-binding protein [Cyanobium sp. FGCU6]MEB3168215.1 heme-binding protein [Synechococcaceae cyanobacterium]
MRSVPLLELADARRIAAAAQAEADRRGATVTVALVDSGGHPLLLERRDGASPSSAVAALGKARMAALNGKPTADQEQAINGPRPALLQLACLLGQPAAAMAGGVPLLHNGHCLGAIGISGMTPEVDAAIAAAGVAAFAADATP